MKCLSKFHLRAALFIASFIGATVASAADSPVQLTYWNWAPHIEGIVEIWNKKNPDIQVTVSRAAGPLEIVPKLIAAERAGNAPDITNVTYQDLPALIVNGLVSDMTKEMAPLKRAISPVAWGLVNFGGTTWATPQGTSPMMLFYREDLFEQFGLKVPTTWEEFAATAKQLRKADPTRYLTTFPTGEPGFFAALTHQVGANWWSLDGDTWTVDIASEPARKVAEYWEDLVATDAVATSQYWSPQWSSSMAEGQMLGFISAVWAPPLINSIAPDTKGKWNVAPLPRWKDGLGAKFAGGVTGGSATAVSTQSKHQAAAKKFAIWITNDPEALEAYIRLNNIWPANLAARQIPVLNQAPSFIPQNAGYYAMATAIDEATPTISWGPNVSTTFDAFKNAFAAAVRAKGGFVEALEKVQQTAVHDMKSQGYTVREGR